MTTFNVYKGKSRMFRNSVFTSYEKARQAVRKYIRAKFDRHNYVDQGIGMWDRVSRNPTDYTSIGFRITKANMKAAA